MKKPFVYERISQDQAIVLFVDHQSGLFSLVQDFSPAEFKNNVIALADVARFFKLPSIITTSFETGPNGPALPVLKQMLPDAIFIPRPGQINAWDNEEFVTAIEKTGRKQLIIAGIVTEVCVALPALSALSAGYQVFVSTDACGTFNDVARYAAWNRMSHAGAQLMNWFSISAELQRDWRHDVEGYGSLLSEHVTMYQTLMISYNEQQQS